MRLKTTWHGSRSVADTVRGPAGLRIQVPQGAASCNARGEASPSVAAPACLCTAPVSPLLSTYHTAVPLVELEWPAGYF